MKPGSGTPHTWRGWATLGSGGGRSVTSARLGGAAKPRNRLFPKTRSWFALDAPLELLSPLSVLRVLFALAVVSWPLIGLVNPWGDVHTPAVVAVSVVTAAIWVVLLRVKKVEVPVCRLLAGFWALAVAVLMWASSGSALMVAFVLFLVPIVTFSALFLGTRMVIGLQTATLAMLWVALAPDQGVGEALAIALLGCLALSLAPVTVLVLSRSARRHDTVDPDTGLPNGFGLAGRVAALDRPSFLVAAVVLEGMADGREALGYQVGTELLRRAVEDLGQVLPGEAIIGRVEGDELVVVIGLGAPDAGPSTGGIPDGPEQVAEAGRALADTLVKAIGAGRYLVGAVEVSLRAHVGLAIAPWDGDDVAELVRRASLTGRHAAERGVTSAFWDNNQGALTADDLALLADLRLAAERGELALAYQPQIGPGTGRTRAVEALLRWDNPVHAAGGPGRFIPLAERTGLIDRLTVWVVAEALDAQARWRHQGLHLPVSVNISAKSLSAPGLADWILRELDERGLPTTCLTVEVTETAVADPDQAAAVLRPLHRAGVRISIDDFGTGFTSLAALPSLPLDELKVDQCFVLRSTVSAADEAIVRTVGELAHRLELDVVAEGVETAEIAELVTGMGFDLLQGYFYAKPMTEVALLEFVEGERLAATGPEAATALVPQGNLGGPRRRTRV